MRVADIKGASHLVAAWHPDSADCEREIVGWRADESVPSLSDPIGEGEQAALVQTESAVEPKMAAPEPQVAALPPASVPTEQGARPFDGEWDLEIWMEDFFPSGLKTRVRIANSKFTVPIKGRGSNGQIQGEILSDGTLAGSGVMDWTMGWSPAAQTLTFSSPFRDGVFSAKGFLKGRGSKGQRYKITLTRPQQSVQ